MNTKCKFGYKDCEYKDYLEDYRKSRKSLPNISHLKYHEFEEELLELITWQNINPPNKDRDKMIEYLERLLLPNLERVLVINILPYRKLRARHKRR